MSDLVKFKPGETRWRRVLQHPFRTIVIAVLRHAHRSREVVIKTPLGFRFSGILPESISGQIWRLGIYEWSTTVLLRRILQSGDHFVDIGAHFGYFTLLAAQAAGRQGKVFAIEAMPETFQRLSRNIALNNLQNVETVNMAAHSKTERLRFRDFGLISSSLNTSGEARGNLFGRDAPAKEVSVMGDRFDNIVPRDSWSLIRAVKIDAESSEEAVLEGMTGFFDAGNKPLLLIEIGGGGLPEAKRARRIAGRLGQYGYRPYAFDGTVLTRVDIDDDIPYMNAVFM